MAYPAVSTPIRLTLHQVRRSSRRTARRLALVAVGLAGAAGLAWALQPAGLRALGWLVQPALTALAQQVLPQGLMP